MRDLDRDPIQPAEDEGQYMAEEPTFLDRIISKLSVLHILAVLFSVSLCCVMFVIFLMLSWPKYSTYLATEDMRQAVLWAETHAKIALILPAVDLNQYVLYTNLEDTDVESLDQK